MGWRISSSYAVEKGGADVVEVAQQGEEASPRLVVPQLEKGGGGRRRGECAALAQWRPCSAP